MDSNDKCCPGAASRAWTSSGGVIQLSLGQCPVRGELGKGLHQRLVAGWFSLLGSAGGILPLPTVKAWGGWLRLQPSPYLHGRNTVMLALSLSYQTQTLSKEGNRKPFVIPRLGLSLRRFSEFIVHSSLELPYTQACIMFEWNLGQGWGKI